MATWHDIPIFREVLHIKHNLARKLKELRKKSGLTQAQLADKLEISASAVGMYEQGRREPDNKTLSKICRILDASGDYVLDLDEVSQMHSQKADIYNVISDFIKNLENEKNLMFNGEPINQAEKKKITSALKVATAVTLSDIDKTL
ncbi:MAG: helix-turn-helix transcriptional regulator [Clostridia bacterium]|nr:helix-turn-helix transcriptional regulator [Clostridia bacterium]